jgi:tetratricopeptide (TPR) repeat protein
MSSTAPENYPGNPSLPREVREKILSTFRHTLNLYQQGKTDDCLIGCDFILKMDPRFAPARKLMDKAKNPAAAVNVAELEAVVTTTPTRQERVAAVDPDRLLVRAVESFNARDFDAAIGAAEQVLAVLPGNRDALEILDKAAGKKAAQPLFDASRQRAIAALESNRQDDARRELDRMRGLDPDHPAVALLARKLGGAPPPAPAAGPPLRAPVESSDEINFDLAPPEPTPLGLGGGETREPEIRFDDGATVSLNLGAIPPPGGPAPSGLDSLSLDSLSLEAPAAPPAPPPPPKFDGDATNPGARVAPPPPPPPRGSPADLWSASGAGGLDLEPEPLAGPAHAAPPPPSVASIPPPVPPEEEDTKDNEREIEALLRQGDEVARRGDRQQAIEIWSRIFLIDINNTEAVNRIEKVRQEMAEGNRTISECLKAGREKFEAGDHAGARELFLQVLAVDENEPTARFYIDRIEEELARGRGEAPAEQDFTDTPTAGGSPSAGAARAPAPPAAAGRRAGLSIPPRVLALVGIALVASAVGAYFVFKTPKPPPASAGAGSAAAGSLARARELMNEGKTDEARQELSRVPRSSADYAQAHKMLAELGSAASATSATAPAVAALPTAPAIDVLPVATPGPNDPARLRAAGEKALTEKHYIEALKNFNLAAPSFRNDPTFAQALGLAADKVAALAPAVKLYNEAEYETAIPVLWRIYQEDRENQDARSYLLRCYFNQGVTELQNGLYEKAKQAFDEALALDGTDTEALRHRKFAEHYRKGDLDLMGRIYVRHLNRRP